MELGAILKNIRREKGMSQKQMAKFLNVSDACICNWEKGKFTPIQAETEMSKIQDEAIAKIRKANNEKLENLRELRDNFDGWNWYSWENPLDRVMRAID